MNKEHKKECPNCREEIKEDRITFKTKDGYEVCSNWCKADWELDA